VRQLAVSHPVLALAKLRIDLERTLHRLHAPVSPHHLPGMSLSFSPAALRPLHRPVSRRTYPHEPPFLAFGKNTCAPAIRNAAIACWPRSESNQ